MGRGKLEPCDFCDGSLVSRTVTVDWRRRGLLVVIEKVPALVCNHCGERYYSQAAMRQMEEIAKSKRSAKRTIKVPVASFETVA
jgi:YgiT-type zinc finger domain-containing protein